MVRVAVVRAQHPQLHLEYVTHEAASERTIARVIMWYIIHSQKLLEYNVTHDGLRSDSERNRAVAVTWARPPGSDAGLTSEIE